MQDTTEEQHGPEAPPILLVHHKVIKKHGLEQIQAEADEHFGRHVEIRATRARGRTDMRHGVCTGCGKRGLIDTDKGLCTGWTTIGIERVPRAAACARRQERRKK